MDKILINKYIGQLSKEYEKGFYNLVLASSTKKVEYHDKANYIYSPNEDLEIIMETTKDSDKLTITNLDLHLESDSIWKFRIFKDMKVIDHSYLVNNMDNTGTYALRIVNSICLGREIEEGDELEAKMCGFVLAANLFPDEETFQKSLPKTKAGEASMTENGSLMPIHLINNYGGSSKNVRKATEFHLDDIIVTAKGILRDIEKVDLKIHNNEFQPYFKAIIDTSFGELPIIFNGRTLSADTKGFNPGYIIVAEILLSADVCINEYEKYRKKSDYLKVMKALQEKAE